MAERSGVRLVIEAGCRISRRRRPPSPACAPVATPAIASTSAPASTGGRPAIEALCFDPQTSGGLLAALDPGAAADLPTDFAVVGGSRPANPVWSSDEPAVEPWREEASVGAVAGLGATAGHASAGP